MKQTAQEARPRIQTDAHCSCHPQGECTNDSEVLRLHCNSSRKTKWRPLSVQFLHRHLPQFFAIEGKKPWAALYSLPWSWNCLVQYVTFFKVGLLTLQAMFCAQSFMKHIACRNLDISSHTILLIGSKDMKILMLSKRLLNYMNKYIILRHRLTKIRNIDVITCLKKYLF